MESSGGRAKNPTHLKCYSVESESERRLHLSVEGECSLHSSHRSQMQRKQIIKQAQRYQESIDCNWCILHTGCVVDNMPWQNIRDKRCVTKDLLALLDFHDWFYRYFLEANEEKFVSIRKNDSLCDWPRCIELQRLWLLVWIRWKRNTSGCHRPVSNTDVSYNWQFYRSSLWESSQLYQYCNIPFKK